MQSEAKLPEDIRVGHAQTVDKILGWLERPQGLFLAGVLRLRCWQQQYKCKRVGNNVRLVAGREKKARKEKSRSGHRNVVNVIPDDTVSNGGVPVPLAYTSTVMQHSEKIVLLYRANLYCSI